MTTPGSFATALRTVATTTLSATLVRRVPLSPLIASGKVDYLFTSGRPYRFNTAGVMCIYFAEDEHTAAAEYERHTQPLRQPFATFFAEVKLKMILDLCSAECLETLNLTPSDLQANWARAKTPTLTQILGETLSQQSRISAIRFPSDAARLIGFKGANVVIFREALGRSDYLRILGPTRQPLQKWP